MEFVILAFCLAIAACAAGSSPQHRSVRVPVQVVVVSDDDGGRRPRVTASQFARWIEFANAAYGDAGVEFTFDAKAEMESVQDTALNDVTGANDSNWPTVKAHGNEIAAGRPGRIVVFVRHGPGPTASGAGFAGTDLDFVVMGGFDDMNHCGHPHLDALAHELGHYLGLPHTFVGEPFGDVAEAEAYLEAHGADPSAFDGDGFSDTPPDPSIRPFECERREQVELNGQVFVLPRRNLMSYYDERDSLSPQQIDRVRWVLERRRRHGMRLPSNKPGPQALEAESLEVTMASDCSTEEQAMDGFGVGDWSGGVQLFCGAGPEAVLTLALPVTKTGTYGVDLYATMAPDFGIVQCTIDGDVCGPPTDLYAPVVLPTGAIRLDRVRLSAAVHRISFEVKGKHPDATGHRFGIDAIDLVD